MDEKDILRKTKEALSQALDIKRRQKNEDDRKYLVAAIGNDLAQALEAPLARIAENTKITKADWQELISSIKIESPKAPEIPEIKVPTPQVTVNVPEIKLPEFPEIKLPTIKVPKPEVTVNFDASKIRIPDVVMPDEMNVRGWVQLQGVDLGNPLPVQIRDADGKPVDLMASMTQMFSSGGGRAVRINNDSNHPIPVSGSFSVSAGATTAAVPTNNDGTTYNSDNPLPVTFSSSVIPVSQVSDATWSVSVKDIFGTTGTDVVNPDGRIKVELPTGSSGLTDTELRATAVPVAQVSGAGWSTSVTNTVTVDGSGVTQPVSATNLDIRDLDYTTDDVSAYQVSGASWSVEATQSGTWNVGTVSSVTNSLAANIVDSSGVAYSGSNPVPISDAGGTITVDGTVAVSGVTNSVQATIIDSSGIGYSGSNPLPVSFSATDLDIRDLVNATDSVSAYQVSGANWSVSVTDIFGTTGANVVNPDGRIKVEIPTGSSGLTDAELRASSVPVEQVSGSAWSTYVTSIFGSTITTDVLNADNRIRVSVETGGSGLTDSELRATAVPVTQVSGASWSVEATITGTPTVQATNLDIRDLDYTTDDVSAYQVSGSSWSVEATQSGTWNIGTLTTVTSVTNSIAAALVDSSGVQYSTTNPVPIDDAGGSITIDGDIGTVTTVTGITNSLAANIVDSTGVAYSGSNPVPISDAGGSITIDGTVTVSGSPTSVTAVGVTVADAADDGSAPVKGGGIARTANPTAVANGDIVTSTHDDVGRQIVRPLQVRDLMTTAYASVTNGTEATLLAGSASTFHDLLYVLCSNQSDAATYIDFRCGTAGSVVLNVEVPATGTAGVALPVPIPMPEAAQAWTYDMPDITGTTINISALFTKEV